MQLPPCHSKPRRFRFLFLRFELARLCGLSVHVCMLVNGVETEAQAGLLALLEKLRIDPGTVAVLVNGEIVPRKDWAEHTLSSADEIEIVKFVGGG